MVSGVGRAAQLTRLLAFAALLAISPAWTAIAGAQESASAGALGLEIKQVGWTPRTLIGNAWNPVQVRVTGTAETESRGPARVRVTLYGGANQRVAVAAYAQELALPTGVTKDVTIYVPTGNDSAYLARVQVLDSSGRTLAEDSANANVPGSSLSGLTVGSLADTATLATAISRVEVPYQQGLTQRLAAVQLSPDLVPTAADYLSGLAVLVAQGNGVSNLSQEQRHAIQQWVARGGHLILIGGPNAQQLNTLLDDSGAPRARFGRLEPNVDLQPLAVWATNQSADLLRGAATPIEASEGERAAGEEQQPLVWRVRWGSGTVTLLAADPTLEPLRAWSGNQQLLVLALEPSLTPVQPDRPSSGNIRPANSVAAGQRLSAALETLPPGAFPSWEVVLGILGGFALLAGPVLHIILRRADRRPMLWVAVPTLAVAATIGMYVFGIGLPGRDVLTNIVSYVRLDPRTGQAQQSVAINFVSPVREKLSASVAGAVPLRAAQAQVLGYNASGGATMYIQMDDSRAAPFEVTTGRETRVDFNSNQAAQRSVVLERDQREPIGTIDTDLQMAGREARISGTIRNSTPYPLEHVALVFGQLVHTVGDLQPGQTVAVDVTDQAARSTTNVYLQSLGWRMFAVPSAAGANARPPSGFQNINGTDFRTPTDAESLRRMRLVDVILSPNDPYSGVTAALRLPPSILAFTSAPLAGGELPTAGPGRTFQLALINEPIDVAVAPGPFLLPATLLQSSVSTAPGATLYPSGSITTTPMVFELRGSATYSFKARLPQRATIDELTVRTQQATAQSTPPQPGSGTIAQPSLGPSTAGTFQIFNWQSNAWEPLPSGRTQAQLSPAAKYVAGDGTIRVQASSSSATTTVRISIPEVSIEGHTN